jgi:hypothetical protein
MSDDPVRVDDPFQPSQPPRSKMRSGLASVQGCDVDGKSRRKAINAVCCAHLADQGGGWYQTTRKYFSEEIPPASRSNPRRTLSRVLTPQNHPHNPLNMQRNM